MKHYSKKGCENPNWKGGRYFDGKYFRVISPNHPFKNKMGYVYEHRLVMEKELGRYLKSSEIVHHKNHDGQDNKPSNLEIFKDQGEHIRQHSSGRVYSEESKHKISLARLGWKPTKETREKMSLSAKKRAVREYQETIGRL